MGSGLRLSAADRALLAGEGGAAGRMAMRILAAMAEVYGAAELLDVVSAHVDGCLFHGDSGLEFAERLVAGGARVAVPTTLNVGAMDLLHADNFNGSPALAARATRLMRAYEEMGCRPTWTCAPYQAGHRPAAGDQVAWAESNAIAFVNSVLGARTNRYGDFLDICAAITGRAPACGLHLTHNRRGRLVYRLAGLPEGLLADPVLAPVLGYHVGADCRTRVPVIVGLPPATDEDFLKALGAAAASSGAVALFHAVGVTPEAPTLEAALHGEPAEREVTVTLDGLRRTRDRLSTGLDGPLAAVALGSPHFSFEEFARLVPLVERWPPSPAVELVVCTHRLVLSRLEALGWAAALRAAGVRLVADTCVVVTPILRSVEGALMTSSAKFAHYTPSNTGLEVVFGSLEECVRSASLGRVWRDPDLWGGA
ncbi:MAG: aconitase X catalytic domain-containing protein [Acidobacteriota bacterium]|nr:aconitase X catalytic domain-containing protein [Acidobacteriota bacterium]MDH3525287.1 aconitase X catalytic domain-containing protein [Acidobacteriota bacterium]